MDWYYAANDRSCGPISESQLDDLLRAGTLDGDSLVWCRGMVNWQPLNKACPWLALSTKTPADKLAGETACAECQRHFPRHEMVYLNHTWICAHCKPLFLQRILEGATPRTGGQIWRHRRDLVLQATTEFPDRCILCNAPAHGYRLKRQLSWAPTGRLVITSKWAMIHVGLCPLHRARRKRIIAGCWSVVFAGLGMLLAGMMRGMDLAWIGPLLILAGAMVASHQGSIVTATKIDEGIV